MENYEKEPALFVNPANGGKLLTHSRVVGPSLLLAAVDITLRPTFNGAGLTNNNSANYPLTPSFGSLILPSPGGNFNTQIANPIMSVTQRTSNFNTIQRTSNFFR